MTRPGTLPDPRRAVVTFKETLRNSLSGGFLARRKSAKVRSGRDIERASRFLLASCNTVAVWLLPEKGRVRGGYGALLRQRQQRVG